jgi:hypothetical protein
MPPFVSSGRGASAWAWWALVLAVVTGASVFFAFDALPFMDYPAHAGLFALRDRYATSPFEQRLYVLGPSLGGYSLFRLVGEGLTELVGPNRAIRVLGAASVVALPVALLDARRRLFGRSSPSFGYLGVLVSFGLMTLFGFASFMLAVALAIECTALWLELLAKADTLTAQTAARSGILVSETALALLTMLLVIAHGFAFVLFILVATVALFLRASRRPSYMRARALLPAFALAGYAAWLQRPSAAMQGSALRPVHYAPVFHTLRDKLALLATPTLMTRSGVDVVVCVLVWIVAAQAVRSALAWLKHAPACAQRSHTRALLGAALLLGLLFMALPHEVGWFGFVDARLLPLVLVFSVLATPDAPQPRLARMLDLMLPGLTYVALALALATSFLFQKEAAGYPKVFANVPAYARVLNLPIDPDSQFFTGHPFVHYDAWMLADRPLLISDLWFHQGSGVYPREDNPVLRLPPEYRSSDIRDLDWSRFWLDDWDFVLFRMPPCAEAPPIPPKLTLVDRAGAWWLYKTNVARVAGVSDASVPPGAAQ